MANGEIFWWSTDQSERLRELISSEPENKKIPLRRDVRSLGKLLGTVIKEQAGDKLFEAEEQLRNLAIRHRELGNTERVLNNATVERILHLEQEKKDQLEIDDIRPLVSGAVNREVLQDGNLDAGAWSCGMVAGLIHDIPTCKELIERIMAEAEEIIRGRLVGFISA